VGGRPRAADRGRRRPTRSRRREAATPRLRCGTGKHGWWTQSTAATRCSPGALGRTFSFNDPDLDLDACGDDEDRNVEVLIDDPPPGATAEREGAGEETPASGEDELPDELPEAGEQEPPVAREISVPPAGR
jgi:hypothetical protein